MNLHEAASEHYLRGEFREAMDAWKALLVLDPSDEQAIEGVRLAEAFSQGAQDEAGNVVDTPPGRDLASLRRSIDAIDAHVEAGDEAGAVALAERLAGEAPSDPDVVAALERARSAQAEVALDRGLSVLDSLSVGIDTAQPATEKAAVTSHEPDASPPAEPSSASTAAPEAALDVAPRVLSPAAAELRRRVDDLLEEAKREASADRVDEALAILSRVFILDEEDVRARALEEQLRAARGQTNEDVEIWIGEGVQEFQNGRLDEARLAFRRVIERCPGHAEAIDYLERIDAAIEGRGASPEEGQAPVRPQEPLRFDGNLLTGGSDSAAGGPLPAAVPDESIPLARTRPALSEAAAAPRPDTGSVSLPAAAVTAPAVRRGSRRLLLGVSLLAALGAAGAAAWLAPRFLQGATAAPEAPVPAVQRAARPAPSPVAPKPAAPARSIAEVLTAARTALVAQDYAAAIFAYDEVLKRDPSHEEARAGLLAAGERYKEMKAELEQIEKAKAAFAAEEFAPTLRILYRVPKGRHDAEVETYTFNAWFNLGLFSLRAANFKEAVSSFDEALAIRRGDPDVRQVRDLAVRFQNEAPDRGLYDRIQGIPFRKIDE